MENIKQTMQESILNESGPAFNSFTYFSFIIVFILVTFLSIFLNIPILRQVLGFIFLTFIPGLLVIYILKLGRLSLVEKIVISAGLSISLVMFVGLLINTIYPLLGYNTPLNTNSVLVSFSVCTLILTIIAYLRNRTTRFINYSNFKLSTSEKTYLLLPALFPLLAILGMRIMNATNNNLILVLLLLLIPAYTILLVIKHNEIPDKIFPVIIYFISIALVILLALRSNYIIGADINEEYSIFIQTLQNERWIVNPGSILSSCLSISIMPTVFQSVLNINSQYLFKILYPSIFSISPLIVYLISRKYLNSLYSFLAVLFFMSQYYFLNAEFSPRTIVALLFFALSIMILVHNRLKNIERYLLFIVFSTSTVLSHYSTTYIFFIALILTWLITPLVFNRFEFNNNVIDQNTILYTENPLSPQKYQQKRKLTFELIAPFFMIIFLWYSIISTATFNNAVTFFSNTMNSIQNFFDLKNRGVSATILGNGIATNNIPQKITFVLSWITIIFIAIGVSAIFIRYKPGIPIDHERETKEPNFLIQKFDVEYAVLSIVCCLILGISISLPYILQGYDIYRIYVQAMIILSPFFVIGGITFAGLLRIFLHKNINYYVILLVLLPYFMCATGTIHQLFGLPESMVLNSRGDDYEVYVVHPQETFAAQWLNNNASSDLSIYSDWADNDKLISQGDISSVTYDEDLIESDESFQNGYFFLGYTGIIDSKLLDSNYQWHSLSQYQNIFLTKNLIFSNGGSQIYLPP